MFILISSPGEKKHIVPCQDGKKKRMEFIVVSMFGQIIVFLCRVFVFLSDTFPLFFSCKFVFIGIRG